MRTRRAGPGDVAALVGLMREFYAEAGHPLDEGSAGQAFRDLIADPPRGAVWLIEEDDRAIGHVVLSVRFAMEFGGLIGYIDDLFVRPAHRRKGAAAAALEALLEECRTRGCRAIEVEVAPDNVPAQAVYRRYGLLPLDDHREHLRVVVQG